MPAEQKKIAVFGLGYVGLPLAIAFAKHFSVTGFDTDAQRIAELNRGTDLTREADVEKLQEALSEGRTASPRGLICTNDLLPVKTATVFIVAVPTPVNDYNAPDLSFLLEASKTLGGLLKPGDIVIYESTVYPGCTEEDCVPVLEQYSGLKLNRDFFVGYSPERISPGDKVHTLTSVKKITSGSTPEIAAEIDALYRTIITAGTHRAPSIRVAEASKAIENAQRDVNISFVNELALMFDRMGIDTQEVLDAAATKYNFHHYKPGLVGGHCISVDPYYLLHKATQLGYHPQVILSGRRVNDFMPEFIAAKLVKLMIKKGRRIQGAKVLLLGITFKEDCPDIRNTRVVKVYGELLRFGLEVAVYDPVADPGQVKQEYGIELLEAICPPGSCEAMILAVGHRAFMDIRFEDYKARNTVIYDAKSVIDKRLVDGRL